MIGHFLGWRRTTHPAPPEPPAPPVTEIEQPAVSPIPKNDDAPAATERPADGVIDLTPLLPPVPFAPGAYRVTYDRVGLHGSAHSKVPAPPPLIADAETGDDLVAKIIADSLRYLGSRTIDVIVDLHLMAGQILTGIGHVGGTFTLEILTDRELARLLTAATTETGDLRRRLAVMEKKLASRPTGGGDA